MTPDEVAALIVEAAANDAEAPRFADRVTLSARRETEVTTDS